MMSLVLYPSGPEAVEDAAEPGQEVEDVTPDLGGGEAVHAGRLDLLPRHRAMKQCLKFGVKISIPGN